MIAIEYKNVAFGYGGKLVVDNFNISIKRKEFVTVLGSSGSGKTTILKMVNGLIFPTAGQVFVMEQDTRHMDLIRLRRGIGYAIQGNALFPHMTVEKNVAYVPSLLGKKERKNIKASVGELLELVGLDEGLRKCYPHELSGGQQQRVGIARALAASQEILLMDEPFGALDGITRSTIQKEIKHIHKSMGLTIFFVTHDVNEALGLGTKVLLVDRGRVLQYDSPAAVTRYPANAFVERLLSRAFKPYKTI